LYNDEHSEYRMRRWPMSLVEIGTEDAERLGIRSGDVVELFNDYGVTRGMAHVEPTIGEGQLFMLAMGREGVQGNITTPAVDENIIPYYKGSWAGLRRIGDLGLARSVTGKTRQFNRQEP
ncbi:MAG: molybdopterin dinucleotide binding domain-containing protein, partial [Pseudomonas sp.]